MSKKQAKAAEPAAPQQPSMVNPPSTSSGSSEPALPLSSGGGGGVVQDSGPLAPAAETSAGYDPSADDAAALATLKAAVSGDVEAPAADEPAKEPARAEAEPKAKEEEKVPDPWSTLKAYAEPEKATEPDMSPEDQRLMRLLQQVQAQERELVARRQTDGLSAEEAAEAKRLIQLKKMAKTDPEVWFREAGWDKETIENYIQTGGQTPLKPIQAEFEGKISTLNKQIEEMKAFMAQQQQQAAIMQFKGVIPQHISANEDDYPHLTSYYDSQIDQMEAVWNVIHHARTVEQKSLTVAEAAGRLEKALATEAEKFAKAQSKKGKPAKTETTKTPTQTLNNKGGNSSGVTTPDDQDWAALDYKALSLFAASRKAS